MATHFKRLLSLVLVVCVIMSLSFGVAAAEPLSQTYIYAYSGNRYESSPYNFRFQWMRGNNPIEDLRKYTSSTGIFQLESVTQADPIPAYCCDFIESAVAGTLYRRINLEDASYFDSDVAAHIRGIFQHGYWPGRSVEEIQTAANTWLASYDSSQWQTTVRLPGDAEDPVEPIVELTKEEAITATQFAIWGFANTDSYWMRFATPDGPTTEHENGRIMGTPFQNNIMALRKYLLHQAAAPMTKEDLLFSDQHFISSNAVFSSSGEVGYDISVYFKLRGTIDSGDDLTLTATLGEQHITKSLTSGEDRLSPGKDGFYCIRFTDLSAEAVAASTITLSLSGSQLAKGVYFYEAQPADPDDEDSARESSQNMVGWYEGSTPVHVTAEIPFEVGNQTASIVKYDAGNTQEESSELPLPLSGVQFNLYAIHPDTQVIYPVKSGLTTDENGRIAVTHLPNGYNYFFRESAPLPGYRYDPTENYPAGSTVGNRYELGELTITKQVEGIPTDQHFQFDIALALDNAPLPNAPERVGLRFPASWTTENCDDTQTHPVELLFKKEEGSELYHAKVLLAHRESLTLSGIPAGTPYTVTEEDSNTPSPGVSYQITSSDHQGIVTSNGSAASFVNLGYIPVNVSLKINKTIDGTDAENQSSFTFYVEEWNQDTTSWRPVCTAQNRPAGQVHFDLPSVYYTLRNDTWIYRIREEKGSAAFVYDTAPRYALVTIGETSEDGQPVAEITYYDSFSEITGSPSAPIQGIPVINNQTIPDDPPESPTPTPSAPPTPSETPPPSVTPPSSETPPPSVTPPASETPTPVFPDPPSPAPSEPPSPPPASPEPPPPTPSAEPSPSPADDDIMSEIPKTGDFSAYWGLGALLSASALLLLHLKEKRKPS